MFKAGWIVRLLLVVVVSCVVGSLSTKDSAMTSMLRTYFQCPECDPSACPEPVGCIQKIKEPGVCACCYTCARQEGEDCGVFTSRCAPGLTCQPPNVDRRTDQVWSALFKGKAVCVPTQNMVEPSFFDKKSWN